MLRRTALFTVLVTAFAGLTALGLGSPAQAAVSSSNITSPVNGTRYLITDASPETTVGVVGTTNGTTGDFVDVRCYYQSDNWTDVENNVAVQADGSFTATLHTGAPYGTCILRAVPHGLPANSGTSTFTGPRLTTEWRTSDKVPSGPNTGKTFDYYVLFQGSRAMNDYVSATRGGLWDSRLQYTDGTSSNYFWFENAALTSNEGGTRSYLQVDSKNAYGPAAAYYLFSNNPGLPALTYSASRDAAGNTTIHEVDPIVRCTSETFPPDAGACTQFLSTGVRLERTIYTDDGGRQVHITDVWRSTDGHPHTVSAHYEQWVDGSDDTAGALPISLRLPWLGSGYQTFTAPTAYTGTAHVANTLFVRDDNTAPDGDTSAPRGAITFDTPLSQLYRWDRRHFTLREDGISVPAGGTRRVRHDYVMGTTEAQVAASAAASRTRINPRRPDGLVRRGSKAYVGNNVYNTTGAGQTATARKKRGKKVTFSVLVQNDGTFTDTFKIKGTGAKKGFTVTYFAGKKDITSAVTHGTYKLRNLASGQQKVITLVIRVKASARKGALRGWLVTSTSTHDTTSKDSVKATVKVKQ